MLCIICNSHVYQAILSRGYFIFSWLYRFETLTWCDCLRGRCSTGATITFAWRRGGAGNGGGGTMDSACVRGGGNIYGSMHPISPLQNLPSSWNTSNKVPRALRTRYLFWGIRGTYPAIVPCTRRTPTSNMSFDAPAAGADNRSAPPKQKGRLARPMFIPR